MNMTQIKTMMQDMTDKPLTANDNSVMECILQVYCQTVEIDHEEVRFLWENYLQKGILDFPSAMKMARKRIA